MLWGRIGLGCGAGLSGVGQGQGRWSGAEGHRSGWGRVGQGGAGQGRTEQGGVFSHGQTHLYNGQQNDADDEGDQSSHPVPTLEVDQLPAAELASRRDG